MIFKVSFGKKFAFFVVAVVIIAFFISLAFWHFDKKQGLRMSDLKDLPELKELDVVLRAGIDLDSLIIQQLSNSPYSHIGVVINTKPLQILHASSTDTQNKVAVSEFSYFLAHAKGIAVKRYMNFWTVGQSYELENVKNSSTLQGIESKNGEFTNADNQGILNGTERQDAEFENSKGLDFQNAEFTNDKSLDFKNAEFKSGKGLDFQSTDNQAIKQVLSYLKAQIGKEFKLFNEDEKLYCTTLIEDAFNQVFTLNLPYEKLNLSLLSGEYLFPKAFYEDNQSVLIYEFKP
ncbi:hypothetical protein [Campylobacter troglodytis]|uniref:hypothetical protein n=1 Tax=Campylobacter troglodytis TaxID=654363 RepID=UPI001157D353|nr:hypothetical protein [Campylobacter troglodytis]TQR60455.1 hypothetical protein DMC01_05615 [Campylobacter troglodytis]